MTTKVSRMTVAVVTCGPQLEVAALASRSEAPSLVRLAGVSPRSTLLLAAVDLLVEDAGATPEQVERVVVTRGPGSFTGIRAGLATAAGLHAAVGAQCIAYDSLSAQAARCLEQGEIWCAQPSRRGEVYAQQFMVGDGEAPRPLTEIEIMAVADLSRRGPWAAAEALDLGGATRIVALRSTAEALLEMASAGIEPQPLEPLYVEGPPIHGGDG